MCQMGTLRPVLPSCQCCWRQAAGTVHIGAVMQSLVDGLGTARGELAEQEESGSNHSHLPQCTRRRHGQRCQVEHSRGPGQWCCWQMPHTLCHNKVTAPCRQVERSLRRICARANCPPHCILPPRCPFRDIDWLHTAILSYFWDPRRAWTRNAPPVLSPGHVGDF